jgi:hypothetical protein
MTGDAEKAGRVMGALMTMQKVDIRGLNNAAAG